MSDLWFNPTIEITLLGLILALLVGNLCADFVRWLVKKYWRM
jgi:hypothetical protein